MINSYLSLILLLLCSVSSLAQTTYTWNGSVNQNWNTSTNWTPNGTPGASDHVIIVTGSNDCKLGGNQNVTNLTVTSGTLDLNGKVLTATGTCLFTAGNITAGVLTITASTTASATFTNPTIAADISVTSGNIYFNGGTYNGTVYARKTGSANNPGNGGCTFNADVDLGLTGSGYFMFAGTSFDNYNGNVVISNTGTNSFYFGWNSAGVNLASGKTITAASFAANTLYIVGLTQAGTTAQNMTLTGTAAIDLRRSTFGGNLTVTAPRMTYTTSTFNGTCNFTKNGAGNDASAGGNIFNGAVTINQAGSGYFMFANTLNDVFNENIVVNNTGTHHIYLGWNTGTVTLANTKTITAGIFAANGLFISGLTQVGNTTQNLNLTGTASIDISRSSFDGRLNVVSPRINLGTSTFNSVCNFTKTGAGNDAGTGGNTFMAAITINQTGSGYFMFASAQNDIFNDDIIVNNTGTHNIYLGWNSATVTLANGKTITAGTYIANGLFLSGWNQIGTTTQNITLTGTATLDISRSTFNADINVNAPRINLTTTTYNGLCSFTKTGAGNDAGNGGNTFNKNVTITNTGSGYFMFAGALNDNFLENIFVNNTGTHDIFLGYNSTGITLQNTKTITAGTYTANTLHLTNFTQLGSTAQTITLTGTAGLDITNSTFAASLNATAPRIILGTSTFNGISSFTKTGAGSDVGLGGNTFNKEVTITNSGSGYFMFSGNGTANDMFNDNIIVNNNGTNNIFLGWNSGTVTLANTKTITAGSYAVNTLYLCNFTQLGNTTQNIILTGTAVLDVSKSTFNAVLNISSPRLYISTSTFNGNANFIKTGAGNDDNTGGNTYNGTAIIGNSGSGHLRLATSTADTWNGNATFNNTGSNSIFVAYSSPGNTFNGITTFNNSPTAVGGLINCNNSGANTRFNGDIIVTNVNGGGVLFSNGATGAAILASGKTITVGAAGFNSGTLDLPRFTQVGNTAQSITLTGTGRLNYGPAASFGGDVTSVSPQLYFQGCTFSRTATCTKSGATHNTSTGNNIFTGVAVITNSGTGNLTFGSTGSDQFLSDATFNNTGSNNIYTAYSSSGNIFNGVTTFNNAPAVATGLINCNADGVNTQFMENIIVTNVNGGGVLFSSSTGTATLAAGKTITVGPAGFNSGTLDLRRFTQIGNTAQNITLTSTGRLKYGPSSAFGGDVTSVSPELYFQGCTFSGTTNCTKNGAVDNNSDGNNIFTGVSVMNCTGSGYLLFGNLGRDQFLTDVTFNNTGSHSIYTAHASTNNIFGGNVTVNLSGAAAAGTNSYMMCSGTGASAVISGNFVINNNTVSGSNPGGYMCDGASTSLTVNGTTTINNGGTNSSNYIRFANGASSSVTFNGDVIANNNGVVGNTQVIHFAPIGTNTFNANITLTSTGGSGIYFGYNGGSVVQANNKTINTGTYTGGILYIRNFTQSGPTYGNSSNVSITGTNMALTIRNSTFYDNLTGTAQLMDVYSSTFNGDATLTKTPGGNNTNSWAGGNVFNGNTIITNQAAAHNLSMANTVADDYNGNVTFVKTGAGFIQPNYGVACTYAGNITVNSASVVTFGGGGGTAILDGSSNVTINKTVGSADPKFTRLTVSKSAGNVTLNTKVNVSATLTLTWGLVNTTQTNILNMLDASTTTIGNVNSYINGPMNYDMALSGTRTLNLPIGKSPDWRPAELTAVHSAATSYTYNAEVFDSSARWWGWTLPATVNQVSNVHYWDIDRSLTGGASSSAGSISANQTIKLYYGNNDGVTNPANVTIVKNTAGAPTAWIDIGGTGATATTGSVSSTSSPTAFNSYSRFTLGNKTGGTNPLPVELISFTATQKETNVDLDWGTKSEINSSHFVIEKSQDLKDIVTVGTVKAAGYSSTVKNYFLADEKPFQGESYYRLKEYDQNNMLSITSDWVKVNFEEHISNMEIFPNPVEYGNNANISLSGFSPDADVLVILRDVNGKEIYAKVLITNAKGEIYSALDPQQKLAQGVYIVMASSDDKLFNRKLIIK